jgi:uncharacterized integral membrane protein
MSTQPEPQAGSTKVPPKLIVGIVLAVLALVFIFQNTEKREVNFLFWDISAPTWLWMLIVFAAGVVVGLLIPRFRNRGKT